MSTILDATAEWVRRRQQNIPLRAGQWWRRGGLLVAITEVSDDLVRWRSEDGTEQSGTPAEFLGRALDRITVEIVPGDSDYLAHAWVIAGARETRPADRIVVLMQTIQRAPTEEARARVGGWMAALSQGMEPTR